MYYNLLSAAATNTKLRCFCFWFVDFNCARLVNKLTLQQMRTLFRAAYAMLYTTRDILAIITERQTLGGNKKKRRPRNKPQQQHSNNNNNNNFNRGFQQRSGFGLKANNRPGSFVQYPQQQNQQQQQQHRQPFGARTSNNFRSTIPRQQQQQRFVSATSTSTPTVTVRLPAQQQ